MNNIAVAICQQCGSTLQSGAESATVGCPDCLSSSSPSQATHRLFPLPEKIASALALAHVGVVRTGHSSQYCRGERSNGECFGIHVVPAQLGGVSPQDAAGFFPEASTAGSLRHPNIVSFFHFGELDGYYLLVTEWLEGWTLDDCFRENQIRWDQGETIGASLAEALHHAHEQGIPHRALNPAAVYQTAAGDFKIFGFGLANLLLPTWEEQLARSGRTSRDYLAPELIQPGLIAGNHLSDIFGLGRILYQCFCAELPSGAFASMPSQKTGLPTFIDDAVLGAMHYEPDQRPQSIAQLVQELSGHLTRVPTDTSSDQEDPAVRNSLLKRYDHDFSWLRWFLPIALTVTVLGLLSHFAFQYITAPDPESEQALLHSSLDPNAALTLIARARVLHADGQVVPSKAIIKEVATSADTSAPVLKEMLSTLEDWEEYELALELGKAFTDRSPFETQVRNDLSNILAAREKIIVPFLEFQALSDSARTQGDDFLELEALQRSAELIPGSMTINRRINENPVFIYSGIMDGIGALKSLHPDYDSWRIHVYVDRKGSRVDLSHNIGLNNIGPLAGLPINELDISWTRVTDLSPVQSMPISVLRIDSTPIRDISPLEKNSLTVFTFNHAPVTDVSVLEEMKSLKSARGHYKDSTFKKYLPPNAASVWENTLGMRFRPIDDGKALMSVWETRYADYRAYAISSKLAIIPEMLRFADDKWLADGATWKKPGYDTKDDHPVVGVSKRDIARFCKWLTEKDLDRGAIKKGQLYRLPTDSEWNTVVQTTNNILLNPKTRSLQPSSDLSPYNSLPNQALEYWEGITSEASALPTLTTTEAGGDEDWIGPVGRFDSINGFYDLLGNVREWCSDTSDHKQTGSIVRGSDFSTGRISPQNRTSLDQEARYSDLGFRIVLQLKPPKVDLPLITALNKKNWETAAKIALPDAINHPNRAVRDAARDYLVLDRWIADPTKRGSDLLNNSRLKSFGESTYFLVRIPLPWADAKAIAAATGGHLAVVTSPEEQKWIEDEFFGPQSAQTLWLGAFARGSDWKWITGDPWGFEHRPIPKPDSFNAALILVPTHLSKEGTHHFANWLPDNPLEPHAFLIEWHTPQSLPRADEQDNPLSNASPHDPVDTGSSSAITTAGDSLTAAP